VIRVIPIPLAARIRPGDDLAALLVGAVADAGEALADGDVLVVAQKPVSKAEGRIVDLASVTPSAEAAAIAAEDGGDPRLVEVILRESAQVVRRRGSFIVGRSPQGHVLGSSGVDRSNQDAPDHVTLLPVDPDASARALRDALRAVTGAEVAVVISDSIGRPFRRGTVGVALGAAGLATVVEHAGRLDDVGRPFHSTQVHVADQLASAAELALGPAGGVPAAIVRGAVLEPGPEGAATGLIDRDRDLFA
jgi:coenzyme F420-0:L-glutamate ligase/coenzyme F420-1:gamma-L-glutamate ligase